MSDQNTPDWATKITAEEFFGNARWDRARGTLSVHNREVLDRLEPGWYDVWETAHPQSDEAIHRRNAICEPLVPTSVQVLNHDYDAGITLKKVASGEKVEVHLQGTDDEMRGQVLAALAELGHEAGDSFRSPSAP
jgi:hypothetical protein